MLQHKWEKILLEEAAGFYLNGHISHMYIQKCKSYLVSSEIRSGLWSSGRAMTFGDCLDFTEALL